MRKRILQTVGMAALMLFTVQSCKKEISNQSEEDLIKSELLQNNEANYIIRLKSTELSKNLTAVKGYKKKQAVLRLEKDKILDDLGIESSDTDYVYSSIKGFTVKLNADELKKLKNNPLVAFVEKDRQIDYLKPIKVDEVFEKTTTGTQTLPWGIVRVNGGVDGTGKVAWIIDTGIDLDHPDLIVDADRGASFVLAEPSVNDENGHGTHCAGIIAAIDNDFGTIGVAAGATVVPIKVLSASGSGSLSGIIAGVDYVAENAGANDVANMSLGGGTSVSLDAAVYSASSTCKFTLSAGNDAIKAEYQSPGRVNGENVYTISAFDYDGNYASFSNYGNPPVDYCEPGVGVYSTWINGSYTYQSGTSMAAPHMAGILLLGLETDGNVAQDPDGEPDLIAVVKVGTSEPPVNNAPVAGFTFNANQLSVEFTNASTDADGEIASVSWSFGDGSTSTLQNPTHLYSAAGTYNVTLTATDNEGAVDTEVKTVLVSLANVAPVAGFSYNADDLSVSFTNASTDADGEIASVSWSFGDGSTSTLQNPTHLYSAVGTYNVTLTATDNEGAVDTEVKTVLVSLANVAPVADFSYNADELSVYFTDVSTDADGSVESRNWNFGDGSTSTSQNPTHKYTVAGTYTVSLLVTDNNGATNNNQKSITVVVANKNPIAGFSFNTSDLSVAFTDNSNDTDGSISSRVWDFGDGATSSVQTPTHSYSSAGTYTVKLTVVDNDGASDTEIKTITVTEAEEVVEVIDLTARASKKRGVRIVQLNWRGADGSVTVYRNGRVVATNVSASSFSDNLGKNKGTYSYKVCASDGSSCSEEISVNVR